VWWWRGTPFAAPTSNCRYYLYLFYLMVSVLVLKGERKTQVRNFRVTLFCTVTQFCNSFQRGRGS